MILISYERWLVEGHEETKRFKLNKSDLLLYKQYFLPILAIIIVIGLLALVF